MVQYLTIKREKKTVYEKGNLSSDNKKVPLFEVLFS